MNLKTLNKYERYLRKKQSNSFGAFNEECPICMEPFTNSDFKERQCGHAYHKECILEWENMGRHDCPICRNNDNEVPEELVVPRNIRRNLLSEFNNTRDYESDEEYGTNGRLVYSVR